MIVIQVDDAQVLSALNSLRQRAESMRPAMAAIGNVLRRAAIQRFAEQRGPDGTPWPPLSAAAIVSRARRHAAAGLRTRRAATLRRFTVGAKALLDTGALRASIGAQGRGGVYELTDTSVAIGTRLRYAAIHQFGGAAGRGRRAYIPARPYLGIDDGTRGEILAIVARRLRVSGGNA